MGDAPVISFDNLDALAAATSALAPADASPGFAVVNLANQVTFKQQDIAPPSAFYVTVDDLLVVQCWNSDPTVTSIQLQMRVLTPDGQIKAAIYVLQVTSNRAVSTALFQVDEGFILSAFVQSYPATPKRGRTYASATIYRGSLSSGGPRTEQLVADYVTNGQTASYPVGRVVSATEGPGVFRSITGTAPAAGANISEVVPTGARWRIVSFSAILQTNTTVASRQVYFLLDDGTNSWYLAGASVTEPASSNYTYSMAGGVSYGATALTGGNIITVPAPVGQCALGGWRIRTVVLNLQTTDLWLAPQYVVEEWIDT